MTEHDFNDVETSILSTITDNAQYDFKSKIAATLRYSGGKEIERTDRTPAVYQTFMVYNRDLIKEQYADQLTQIDVDKIANAAFEQIVKECTDDFFMYRKATNNLVKMVYLAAIVILVIALLLHLLGWTV